MTKQSISIPEPDLILPELDQRALLAEAARLEEQNRYLFAVPRKTEMAPHLGGRWSVKGDRASWQYHLQSRGAESLNLAFSEFRLPPSASLTISDPTGNASPITFTDRDNDDHGELWTPIFVTDQLVLNLDVPTPLVSDVRLRLAKTNHGFRSKFSKKLRKAIGDSTSGSCNIDVICSARNNSTYGPLIDLYRDQIRSVAAYTLGGIETCSGALINNTRGDLTPFFLTADHCGINFGNAASMVFYWNFENSFCRTPNSATSGANGDGPITQFNSGAIFRAARSRSDFCLVQLDDPVNPAYEPFFAGWNRSGQNVSMSVGIHHPGVSEKRISFDMNPTTITGYGEDSPRSGGPHFRVADWDFGTTEGGSSGSPLFDGAGRIVGQLHGGSAACGNNLPDWYGRLSESWTGGGTSSTRLSNWLDPDNTGQTIIDGTNALRLVTIEGTSITEGDSGNKTVSVNLALSEPSSATITVNVRSQPVTAGVDDFIGINTQVTFSPGQTTQSVSVEIIGDTVPEENETFLLSLISAQNASVSDDPARITIINDDFITPIIDSSLNAQGFANSPLEYRISALNTPSSFALSNAPAGMQIDTLTGVLSWIPSSTGTFTATISATNNAGTDSETLQISITPNSLSAAVDLPSGITLRNASPGWAIQNETTSDGVDAAKADPITDGASASFSFDIEGPDFLNFQYRVSSEEDFDFLTVSIDGEEQQAFSGETGWLSGSLVIPVGSRTVTFAYIKDGSESQGQDTAWLDAFDLASTTGRPAITSSPVLSVDPNSPFEYNIESIDPTATFEVSGLPAGLTFNGDRLIAGSVATPGNYSFDITATSESGVDSLVVSLRIFSPVDDAVDFTNVSWTRDGDELWFGQSDTTFDGIDAAQSGDIGNSASTSMSIFITGPDRLSFSWKVSSEEEFDKLSFLIDGEPVPDLPPISGDVDWTLVQVNIPGGRHILTWEYSKDDSSTGGQDAAWVDDVRFENGSIRPMIWTLGQPPLLRNIPAIIPLEFINSDSFSMANLPEWLTYREDTDELIGTPPARGDYTFSATANGPGESITRAITLSAENSSTVLASALGQPNLAVTTGGNGVWFRNSLGFSRDPRSGTIRDGQSSNMTLLLQGPGTVFFDWTVSSEAGFDFLSYSLNGIPGEQISGEVPWQEVAVELAPGQNQLTWTYRKDGAQSRGQDFGSVRRVRLAGYADYLIDQRINHYSSRPEDDPDGNGLPIILEYAFGIEPGQPGSFPEVRFLDEAGQRVLEFEAPEPPSDVAYVFEESINLEPRFWRRSPGVVEITPLGDLNRYRLPVTVPRPNEDVLFFRLRIGFREPE